MSTSVLALLALSTPAAAAAPDRVDLCHWDGSVFQRMEVPTTAAASHLTRHGDVLAGTLWPDADGDGFGDASGATVACPTPGWVANATDCDDDDAGAHPGATEVPYDGVDNDCAPGTVDDDLDLDGYALAEDCDDADAAVNPGAEEVCDDGVDDDCDGVPDDGCLADCPCFAIEDIDAAWQEYLDFEYLTDFDRVDDRAFCEDISITGDGYGTESASVTFRHWGQELSAPVLFEGNHDYFWGATRYSQASSAQYLCIAQAMYTGWDGTNLVEEGSLTILNVTPEEAAACTEIVRTWVEEQGWECLP